MAATDVTPPRPVIAAQWLLAQLRAAALWGLSPEQVHPWRAEDGGQLRYMVESAPELQSPAGWLLFDESGQLVPVGAGMDVCMAQLRRLDFPGRPLSRLALLALLRYTGALAPRWVGAPLRGYDPDEASRRHQLASPYLCYADGDATLGLESWDAGRLGGGYMASQRHQLTLTFAADGSLVQRLTTS